MHWGSEYRFKDREPSKNGPVGPPRFRGRILARLFARFCPSGGPRSVPVRGRAYPRGRTGGRGSHADDTQAHTPAHGPQTRDADTETAIHIWIWTQWASPCYNSCIGWHSATDQRQRGNSNEQARQTSSNHKPEPRVA